MINWLERVSNRLEVWVMTFSEKEFRVIVMLILVWLILMSFLKY